ncbi:phosphodiester glycosidase family protein [Micromonospora sp. HM5-17]|uniref:phosphodiester glycosidase family protein n=1 Tax=Micromonospora sp. HM5-17 TaxID=2487710 RepID=UPI001F38AD8A|nr:phosphodiester glycosidase family protein [Micromonospora sp. HM5-17]
MRLRTAVPRLLRRPRTALASLALGLTLTLVSVPGASAAASPATGTNPSAATGPVHDPAVEMLAPGVTYRELTRDTAGGTVRAHLVEVDLRNPLVSVDLLTAGAVAARAPISAQADQRRAIAAVNGDFFNISNTQPGVEVTGASVGPAIAGGRDLKGAVPTGQRFGPALPPGTSTEDVIGVGVDRVGRLARVTLQGKVTTGRGGGFEVDGLNQYALPVDGIGVFDHAWGSASRRRPTCGTDTQRSAPCSTETYEVRIRRGRVTATATEPGSGAIPRDTVVLVGRERGAATLRNLEVGDRVHVGYHLAPNVHVPFRFAVGGFPILRAGQPLDGLDARTAAVRTSAGVSANGRRLYLLAVDGGGGPGLTILDLALMMRDLGATDAVNLDGGGSTTLVTRRLGAPAVEVRNHPSGGAERPVPNGIGVFSRLG